MAKNILLIMTDQQRFDSLGVYGCPHVPTPHIDSLAEHGIIFDNCYANNPVCTPSRASIFTGKPIVGHHVYRLHDNLPQKEIPFPYLLRNAGYETALFGKLHLSSRIFEDRFRHPHDGFDIYQESKSPYLPMSELNGYLPWLRDNHPEVFAELQQKKRNFGHFSEETHLSNWIASSAIDFLEHRDHERPFFCYTSFFDPHDPYNDYPLSMEGAVHTRNLMDLLPEPDSWDCMPEGIRREHYHGYLGNPAALDSNMLHNIRLGYHASIAFIDKQVGRILDALDRLGLRDDTLIIYSSDHGDMLGDHGLLAKGAFFYEPCVKVPLIMDSPTLRSEKPRRCGSLVQGHDIASTILHYADIPESQYRHLMPESVDLHSTAGSEETLEERPAVCLYRGTSIDDTKSYFDPPINAAMIRSGNWKLTLYFNSGNRETPLEGQLFDLEHDPQELKDRFSDPEYQEIKLKLLFLYTARTNEMDFLYNASLGGENFPPRSHWSQNNPV
jgi:arylsulfatase